MGLLCWGQGGTVCAGIELVQQPSNKLGFTGLSGAGQNFPEKKKRAESKALRLKSCLPKTHSSPFLGIFLKEERDGRLRSTVAAKVLLTMAPLPPPNTSLEWKVQANMACTHGAVVQPALRIRGLGVHAFIQPRVVLPDCVRTEHGRLYSADSSQGSTGAARFLDVAVASGEALPCTGGVYQCVQRLNQFTPGPECSGTIYREAKDTVDTFPPLPFSTEALNLRPGAC